ncbi:MAG: tRNA (adenosine(37)-N6)-threonylcarbamoyltransferase complex dimerization subunit type 1 TsaB [Bacteroidales bacterium]|nr:tRNA (adenosine(37)-N6)-threonylcarbamoyltransferase complex dimerization subunit type 1 TsaB [Bacteroidales bacterium]
MTSPTILLLESSTATLSVALCRDGDIASVREKAATRDHAALLLTFVDDVIRESGLRPAELDAVAVSKGPGSYTGLRIGVSSAKGLCYALDKPLIAVNPLQALAMEAARSFDADTVEQALFCPMTDAGRMEVYAGLYTGTGETVRDVQADIVTAGSYAEYLVSPFQKLYFLGNGAEKCRSVLGQRADLLFLPGWEPNARYMAEPAIRAFTAGDFEDTAYFVPFYLKDFVAGKPHVKGL